MSTDLGGRLWDRLEPGAGAVDLGTSQVLVVVLLALVVVGIGPVWRVVRLAVTLVHELGHAFVGVLVGRQFTGFVLRGDMSGEAVTRGRPRGPGRIVTTWAGYPAPAIVGAALVWCAGRGWAAPALGAILVLLLVALVRVRSLLTLLVMLVAMAAVGSLWWWRNETVQAEVLVGTGLVLLVGAWRHLGAVAGDRSGTGDPGALARLTGVPAVVWVASFALVCAASTWVAVGPLVDAVRT